MTWDPHRRLLTVEEAAQSIDREASTIRRWLSEGRLAPAGKQGRRTLIRESELLEVDADTTRPKPRIVGLT